MYFSTPLPVLLLVATGWAAPYTNATIHNTASYSNKTIEERTIANITIQARVIGSNITIGRWAPHINSTVQSRGIYLNTTSNATVAAGPLVTPAVRRSFIRRKAQAPTTSLCAQLGVVNGCVNADGKGTGNLPAAISVNSALTSLVSEATSLASSLPTPLGTPPKIPVPKGSGAPFAAGGVVLPKAGLPIVFPTAAALPQGATTPLPTARAPFPGLA